jgi:hypothetical protein
VYRFNLRERFPCGPGEFIRRTMSEFDEYIKFAPNLKRLEVLSREPIGDEREKVTIRVYAKAIFPAQVQALFKMSDMDWKQHYIVDLKKNEVNWQVETPIFTEYVECSGTSYVRDVSGGCEMSGTGTMNIGAPPMKGIPVKVVHAGVAIIEPFIGNMIAQNLKKYFKSIRDNMEREAASAKRSAS